MKPEEQAVIEAAEMWMDSIAAHRLDDDNVIKVAVRALRESRSQLPTRELFERRYLSAAEATEAWADCLRWVDEQAEAGVIRDGNLGDLLLEWAEELEGR